MDHSFSIIKSTNEIILEHKYFIELKNNDGGGVVTVSENKYISIDFDGKIKKVNLEEIDDLNINKDVIINIQAILGIINIENVNFILYVYSSSNIGKLKGENIYKIDEVKFYPILKNTKENEPKKIKKIKEGISKLFAFGFYYSLGLDLTSSQQKQGKFFYNKKYDNHFDKSNIEEKFKRIYQTTDKRYFFNYNLYKNFIDNKTKEPIDYNFITPIICGYIGMFEHTIGEENEMNKKCNNVQFVLITRRSQNYAGVRYKTRGVNDDGHVANFCESEQIVIYENFLCSYCQLRGSVPIFFEQSGTGVATNIKRTRELTINAFTRHLQEIGQDYSLIYAINLLNEKKKIEIPLIYEFESQVRFKKNSNNFRYIFFDLQNKCKKDNYAPVDQLMQELKEVSNLFGFFSMNFHTNDVYTVQSGVIRSNCKDCLDRTNLIEARISWQALENMLVFFDFDEESIKKIFDLKEGFFKSSNSFLLNFRSLWGDNGDYISIQYAGTPSTHTTVMKTGGHDFKGIFTHGMATVSRCYKELFLDDFKQLCIDILLQKNVSKDLIRRVIERDRKFKLYFANFNLSGKSLMNYDNINFLQEWLGNFHIKQSLFNEGTSDLPDFFFIGIEGALKSEEKDITKKIERYLSKIIDIKENEKLDSYKPINVFEDHNGIKLFAYTKTSCFNFIRDIEILENKDSLLLNFVLNGTSIALSCSHLPSKLGHKKRFNRINEILNSTFKNHPTLKFKDYDYWFLFGDLGINLEMKLNDNKVIGLFNSKENEAEDVIFNVEGENEENDKEEVYNFEDVGENEELAKYSKELVSDICEAPCHFLPTYKLAQSGYDKNVVPSWSDRILFGKNDQIGTYIYNCCKSIYLSEHHPIYGYYNIKTGGEEDSKEE